jgi:predicted nucleotidyltransferase component of viral defense system
MIDAEAIQRLATRYQTTALSVAREYCQHLFLSRLYQHTQASRVLFKGGTALRIVYGSPRFSEDLDFSGIGVGPSAIEELIAATLSEMERVGLALEIEEAKPTSGGYLGIIRSRFLGYDVATHLEISLRARGRVSPTVALIASDFLPAYTLLHLPQDILVAEKLQALRTRGKPRDYYDLYFILRKGLLPPAHRHLLARTLEPLHQLRPGAFHELRLFLPRDQQGLVKDFRATLEREIRRHVA